MLNSSRPVQWFGIRLVTQTCSTRLWMLSTWAMEKEGVSNVDVVVSESGWPSVGNGGFTTPQLARTYNQNFVKKFLAKQATPKRPDHYLEGFIFAMFNEDQSLRAWSKIGAYSIPDGTPVYPVFS
ncbi:hypothetical protein NL676_029545 [Syzygium grande]|nr:hypothetical protein NL676_029545 [Syzygium grande]